MNWTYVKWIAIASGLAAVGVVIGLLLSDRQGVSEQELEQRAARIAIEKIEEREVENCEADRVFRELYRQRGIVEKELLALEVQANEALIEVVNDLEAQGLAAVPSIPKLRVQLDKLNTKLNDLRAELAILPVPQCGPPPSG